MPRQSKRVLDLSAAEVAQKAPKGAHKPLTERQVAEYQKALAGVQRSLSRLRRASNALAKYQGKTAYYEKLMKAAR